MKLARFSHPQSRCYISGPKQRRRGSLLSFFTLKDKCTKPDLNITGETKMTKSFPFDKRERITIARLVKTCRYSRFCEVRLNVFFGQHGLEIVGQSSSWNTVALLTCVHFVGFESQFEYISDPLALKGNPYFIATSYTSRTNYYCLY